MELVLRSAAFADGDPIPRCYTGEGDDISPPLEWAGAPPETRSYVLIVDDPDAPDPARPRTTWVHWVLFNVPPDASALAENCAAAGLPSGAAQGLNDWGKPCYGGPLPPVGCHRYLHKLYALDTRLSAPARPTKAAIERAMAGHVLASAVLVGTYQKHPH